MSDIDSIAPCSAVQEGFFVSQAINPTSYISHISLRLLSSSTNGQRPTIDGVVNAWRDLVKRHAILRTTFVESNDRPGKFNQLVFKPDMPPRIVVCSSKSDADTVPAFTIREFEVPLRLCVYEVSADELRLDVEISHALVDGHSGRILLHDFRASYLQSDYFSDNRLPYTSFASHQQALIKEAPAGAEYWTSYLNNATESHLPLITNNTQLLRLETAHSSVPLPDGKLRAVCSQLMITPANLFQVAWALAIRRIILSDTITFSYIVSGRNCDLEGADGTVGPFINTLPCSLTLTPETSAADALLLMKRDWQEGLPFQNIVIADLAVAKTRSLKRLGNTLLSIEREVSNKHVLTEGTSMTLDGTSATDFDITANVRLGDDRLDLSLEYWASRVAWPVAKAQMTAFHDAVLFLLEGAGSIRDFPSYGLEDRLTISKWNSTIPPRVEQCVHDLVRHKMVAQPQAQAVSAWDGEMTYSELNEASRRLAYRLVELGVRPEVKVGLCMDKSKLGVVAMLAILRAGGVAVPVGVQHPVARIKGIVEDTSALVMLVDRVHEQRLADLGAHTQLRAVDSFFDEAPSTPTPSAEPCTSVRPENAAWVVYTSGSTGKPKGVVLEHGALATSILAHGPALGVQPNDRLSQFAAYTFDVSIAEIMTPLSIGACICVPSEHDRISRLTAFLSETNVTIATLTSTVAALVQPQDTPKIRTLVLTGEALQRKVVDQWIQQAIVINAYGPSENSIWTTGKIVRDSSEANNIGTPLAGKFWVVNPANISELVPVGATGELLIEGPLLAREYLNDPAKTAAAFVTDPAFVEELGLSPGRRMYRTGDLVQQHPDGSLTYLGRRDTQIKIRGQRVEIGEIESQIARLLPDAREIMVDMILPAGEAHDNGTSMLVAVVEYAEAGSVLSNCGALDLYIPGLVSKAVRMTLEKLDVDLAQALPLYMVPSAFLLTPKIPINVSGKLDRRTIQEELRVLSRESLSGYSCSTIIKQAPKTAMERKLHSLWAAALSLPPNAVGTNDSFFRLGGDSVVAMKLVASARAERIPLSVADIFQWPRLADVAAAIEEKQIQENGLEDKKDPAPLSLWPELAQDDIADADREQLLADVAVQCDITTTQIEDVYPCSPLQAGLMAITTQHPQAYIIQRAFSLEVDIFRYPVLADMASHSIHTPCNGREIIQPFALLQHDAHSFLQAISHHYHFYPADILDAYPCTPLQEGLLALTYKRPGDYISQNVLELSPDITVDNLRLALERVVRATSLLRTRFVQHNDIGLVQLVLKDENIHWIDATNLGEYLQSDRVQPMSLGDPLTRYAFVKDDSGKVRWLVWTMHHALYDGWSLGLMLDAVCRSLLGESIQPGAEFSLFIKYIKNQDDEAVMEYWRKALGGCECIPFPILPASVEHPATDTVLEYNITYPEINNPSITTSLLLRAAWALVAGYMTNSDDVVFGTTVFGRNAPVVGLDKMAGPTLATVPVRVQLNKNQTVREYLESIQHQATAMIPFEQAGLQRIAQSCPEGKLACMFQSHITIQQRRKADHGGLLGKWQDGQHQKHWFSTYAFALELFLEDDKITASAIFDSRVIKPWIVKTLLERLDFILQQLSHAGNNNKKLAEIKAMAPHDLDKIWSWNETVPLPAEQSIYQIFAGQVLAQPYAPAICAWDGELTYSRLDQLSTMLAGRLIALGVKPDTSVLLCFEKSMWTAVAILGVLKAGGSFILLEPSLPGQRLSTIAQQAKSCLVLCSPFTQDISSQLAPGFLTINWDLFTKLDHQLSVKFHEPSPSSVLYTIFTSGSTGTPKGVMITYSNVASAFLCRVRHLGLTPELRLYDFASYSFDVSITNIFTVLVAGGCLCIPSDDDRRNNLVQSIQSLRANALDVTPSVSHLLSPADVPGIQLLIFGGEALHIPDLKRWWGKTRISHEYGPSECTPTSTINCDASSLEEAVNIGKGAGLVTWIVDPENHNELLSPGCIGELLLEGPLVGRGYLNDAERTAASFIHDPIWLLQGSPSRPGRHGRIYKTGDLVRYDEDGSLIFVGRKDTQVKIRGQRVELGEVESALLKCIPEARQIAVETILPQGENSGPALATFICVDRVPEAAKPALDSPDIHILPNAMEVKRQLAFYLPKYMIPDVFLFCSQLPTTAAGKIDRRRIREMGGSLSWASVEQSSDALGSVVAASGGPIPSTEQPAYELAQKIFKMIPSWHQCSLASKKHETTFDDVLLLYSGLDSVNMMTLIYFISQRFHVKVSMQLLLDPTASIRSLARFISDLRLVSSGQTPLAQPSTSLDLIAEIDRHDASIATAQIEGLSLAHSYPEPTSRDNKPLVVLLTGASGFIGTQILRQLLEHRKVGTVIAIVRSQTTSTAISRTIDSAKRALWWTDAHEEKLVVWSGDLSLPNLGLGPTHWRILSDGKTVDIFIHNAAVVHWGQSYAALVDANVKSTVQLLHLAVGAPNARFLYVTGGRADVMEDEREEDLARELVTASTTNADGYVQTKFVAESVVRRAALRCPSGQARLAVVAPGLVIGTPAEGVPNADDYIWRLVAACIRTCSYNVDNSDEWLPMSDVAAMAAMIIDTALDPTTAIITKSRDGMTWGEFWAIIQGMGYQLQGCCAAEWLAAVREDIEVSREKHPLWPVAYMLETEGEAPKGKPDSSKEMGNTPETLRRAVRKNVEFLGRVGFLPHSPAAPEDVKQAMGMQAFSRSLPGLRAV